MCRGKGPLAALVAFVSVLGIIDDANAGVKLETSEDKFIKLGLLMQAQVQTAQDATADQSNWTYDPRIRRLRILLSGQYTDLIRFFVETDQPNWGYRSNWDTRCVADVDGATICTEPEFFVQDAFIELNLHEALQIDVGMLLLPFSHHGSQGATTLLMLDYHSGLIKYLPGATKVWRDTGVMLRGELLSRRLEYRLAITNGVQSGFGTLTAPFPNRLDRPNLTGRLVFNLFESEAGPGAGGFFLDGLYLTFENGQVSSPKKIVSLGLSGMFQKDATLSGEGGTKADFLAAAADVFVDLPLGDATQSVNGQVNFYMYDRGEVDPVTGYGLFAEAGYRYHRWQPVVGIDWYDATEDATDANDLLAVRGGLNYWLYGHGVNFKGMFGAERRGPSEADFDLSGTIQAQLLF